MTEHQIKTPKRRFKGFTGEWEEVTLGDIADIVRGASPRPIQDPKWFDNKSEIGWLRISDVTEQGGRINYLEQRISVLGEEKTRVLVTPHLLVSIAATVGKPVINYVKTGVHDGFLIFLNPKFDLEFMFQWLEMFNPKWKQYGQPGSQVNLNSDIVKNQKIYLPNLQEQHKIGEFFSQLDERIELQKSKVGKMTELKKAYLSEMFPAEGETTPKRRFKGFTGEWEEVKLGEVVNFTNGTAHENIIDKKGNFIVVNSKFISTSGREFKKSKESLCSLYKDDIVLVMSDVPNGKALAKCFFIDKDNTYTLNQRICALTAIDIHSKFLFYIVNRNKYFLEFDNGVGQTNLKKEDVLNCPLMIPNKEEQIKISEFFSELDEMIELHEEKLKKLQDLKQAYLNELLI